MYLTWSKVNAEPRLKQNDRPGIYFEGYLDTGLTRAYRFSRHDEGLHVVSLLSVLLLLLQRDREAVCGREKRIS